MRSKYFYITLLIISFLISGYFVNSTLSLYSAKNTLKEAEERLSDLKDQNNNLKKEISYRKTDEYIINEAREKLNYGYSGEKIVIIPKEVVKEQEERSNREKSKVPDEGIKKPTKSEEPVVKKWFNTFF